MTDLSSCVVPKSDQLNSDDLIPGPRTVRITKVTASPGEQPVSIHFDGDNGKPYKPCKSMIRLLIMAWGKEASAFVGRSMTLYRDPKVKWAGLEIGGIRISHLSHIDADIKAALTETKGKRGLHHVRVLSAPEKQVAPEKPPEPPKPRGDLALETPIIAAWEGTLEALKASLERFSWTKAERETLRGLIEQWTVSVPAGTGTGDHKRTQGENQ